MIELNHKPRRLEDICQEEFIDRMHLSDICELVMTRWLPLPMAKRSFNKRQGNDWLTSNTIGKMSIEKFEFFMKHFGHKIIHIKLKNEFVINDQAKSTITCISKYCQSLTSITLARFEISEACLKALQPIFYKLRNLTLISTKLPNKLAYVIPSSPNLTQITIENCYCKNRHDDHRESPSLPSLCELYLKNNENIESHELLADICNKMPNLKSITYSEESFEQQHMTYQFIQLPRLNKVGINLCGKDIGIIALGLTRHRHSLTHLQIINAKINDIMLRKLACLSNLVELCLINSPLPTEKTQQYFFERMSNLRVLKLENNQCTGYMVGNYTLWSGGLSRIVISHDAMFELIPVWHIIIGSLIRTNELGPITLEILGNTEDFYHPFYDEYQEWVRVEHNPNKSL